MVAVVDRTKERSSRSAVSIRLFAHGSNTDSEWLGSGQGSHRRQDDEERSARIHVVKKLDVL